MPLYMHNIFPDNKNEGTKGYQRLIQNPINHIGTSTFLGAVTLRLV